MTQVLLTSPNDRLKDSLISIENQPYDIPEDWIWVKFGAVCKLYNGYAYKSSDFVQEGIPVIRISDLDGRSVSTLKSVKVSDDHYEERYTVKKGDLLIAMSGATTGKIGIYNSDGISLQNQRVGNIKIIEPDLIIQEYRNYFVLFSSSEILKRAYGGAQPNISGSMIEDLEIPLPPLNEQKRIVERILALLGKIQESKDQLKGIPSILQSLRNSMLYLAFTGQLTYNWRKSQPNIRSVVDLFKETKTLSHLTKTRRGVPEQVHANDKVKNWDLPGTWKYASAADLLRLGVIVDIKDGNHGANHPRTEEFSENGIPFITASQVEDYKIDYSGAKKLNGKPLEKIKVGYAESGDIIYTHKGTVGRVAITDRACILSPQTTYYRVDNKIINNRYLMWFLESPFFKEQVNEVKSQTTRDFVPIAEQYRFFHIIPPVEEQELIATHLDRFFSKFEGIESKYNEAISQIETTPQKILANAFSGFL